MSGIKPSKGEDRNCDLIHILPSTNSKRRGEANGSGSENSASGRYRRHQTVQGSMVRNIRCRPRRRDGVAFFADDGVVDVERYGSHQGRAALIKFFSQMPFTFMFHCLIPKVIEIGHDGLSARGQFRLWELATKPAAAAGDAATPVWVGGEYDDDFIKVGGEWKIKTMRLKLSFITPFDQGWVKKPFAD